MRETQQEGHWDASISTRPLADLIVAALFGTFWTETDTGHPGSDGTVDTMWEALAQALGGAPAR